MKKHSITYAYIKLANERNQNETEAENVYVQTQESTSQLKTMVKT